MPTPQEGNRCRLPPEEEYELLCHLLRKDYAPPLSCGVSTGSNVAKTPSDVRLGMHCAL